MGAPDAEGVYIYTEDDLAAPGVGFSEMLNKAPVSISDQITLIRADIAGIPVVASIDDLDDVDTAGIAVGDILQWDGTNLVPVTPEFDIATPFLILSEELPPFAVATTVKGGTYVYHGQMVRWSRAMVITKLRFKLNTVSGKTYRFMVQTVDADRVVQADIGSWTVASPGTITGTVIETPTLALPVDAGTLYAIGVAHDDGSNSVGGYSRGGDAYGGAFVATMNGLQHGVIPTVGGVAIGATSAYPAIGIESHS